MIDSQLPVLDAHAHIAPDVTSDQIAGLDNAVVFAMTRSLDEARLVCARPDPTLVWGVGVHPGVAAARSSWDPRDFAELMRSFALVGEVGLDRRGGNFDQQRAIFGEVLSIVRDEPVLLSIHSSGATAEVVHHLTAKPPRGAILHWFNGSPSEVLAAAEAGAYFSVNTAMSDCSIQNIPRDRVVCETDYPSRKTKATRPGDVGSIEKLLSGVWDVTVEEVRRKTWWNLRTLAESSGAIERLTDHVADTLLYL